LAITAPADHSNERLQFLRAQEYRPGLSTHPPELRQKAGNPMPNLLMLGKQYEAYVTVLEGQAGGTLIYLDSHGHLHVVPTSPDSRRVAEELEPELKALQVRLEGVAEKLHEITQTAGVGA
jgi:hypothetical protein